MAQKDKSRRAKTVAYFKARDAFMALLAFEIASHARKAARLGMAAGVRLNATSDLPWESRRVTIDGESVLLMDYFCEVQFYDYTKVTKRALAHARGNFPINYHLTFSKTESNDSDVARVLAAGGNVAVVFTRDAYKAALARGVYNGVTVTDGDAHDYRPADPAGCIVALRAKGDARHDSSGFVIAA